MKMSLKNSFYQSFGGLKNIKYIWISHQPGCLLVEVVEEMDVCIEKGEKWMNFKRWEKHPEDKKLYLVEFNTPEEAIWAYECVSLK